MNIKDILAEELQAAAIRTIERAYSDCSSELIKIAEDAANGHAFAQKHLESYNPLAMVGADVGKMMGKVMVALFENEDDFHEDRIDGDGWLISKKGNRIGRIKG